jgi:chromosome partitioning protein
LRELPRVASGRCRIAAVGMRLDARTRAAETVKQWADGLELPFLTVLRETQVYVRCVEQGLSLFDLPEANVRADLAQWQPILDWVDPVLQAEDAPRTLGRPTTLNPLAGRVRPVIETQAAGRTEPTRALPQPSAPRRATSRLGSLLDALPIPAFLRQPAPTTVDA